MRDSLALHLALFRRQRAQIARVVDGQTDSFRTYEARYRRRTSSYQRIVTLPAVHQHVQAADVVYVGDYHTLPLAQQTFMTLTERALGAGRRVVLALECVDAVIVFEEDTPEAVLRRIQPDLWVKGGDYVADELPEAALLAEWGGAAVTVPYHPGRSTTRPSRRRSNASATGNA